jgi:hypothetical protein
MPAKDVKAYIKRNKNDDADAEAIYEAVRRPTVRFFAGQIGRAASQLMLHRTRDLRIRPRTQVINALRAHLAELGIAAAQGNAGRRELLAIVAGAADERLANRGSREPDRAGSGASNNADTDRINREADYCSASFGRSKQAAQEHPRDWSDGRDRGSQAPPPGRVGS